jgi:hypothetical protein
MSPATRRHDCTSCCHGNEKPDSSVPTPLCKQISHACDKSRLHVARLLGRSENTVFDAAISMFPKDGAIQIIDDNFDDEDWALACGFHR